MGVRKTCLRMLFFVAAALVCAAGLVIWRKGGSASAAGVATSGVSAEGVDIAAKDAAKAGHGVAKGAARAGTGAATAATGAAKGLQGDAKGNDKGKKTGRKTDLPQRYEVKRGAARANAIKYEQAVQEQQAERRRSLKTPAGRTPSPRKNAKDTGQSSPSPRKNTNSTPWDVAVEKFLQNAGMLS